MDLTQGEKKKLFWTEKINKIKNEIKSLTN